MPSSYPIRSQLALRPPDRKALVVSGPVTKKSLVAAERNGYRPGTIRQTDPINTSWGVQDVQVSTRHLACTF